MSCRATVDTGETGETAVVVRVLRSGVKLAQQPGRTVTTSSTWYPPSQVKSDTQKLDSSAARGPSLSGGGKVTAAQTPGNLRDSPGPFDFGVSFTRSYKVFCQSDWEYSHKYQKLYVDSNCWVSVLFNLADFTRSQTEFQVRVTAVVSEDFTFSTSSYLPFHLIRLAGASLSSYQQDSQGRHSVIFPISSSAPTCRKIKFTRLSSDLGKEVKVIFSLQDGEGDLVGRRVFSVKIRAEQTAEIPIIEL